jgi:hypothetical protein
LKDIQKLQVKYSGGNTVWTIPAGAQFKTLVKVYTI